MANNARPSNPTVHDFIANFKRGGARPNRYKVFITFPNEINNLGNGGTNTSNSSGNAISTLLSFTCKASKIPAGTMGVAEAAYMGRKIKLAGDREIVDWTVSVYNDTDFKTRDAFIWWQEKILGMSSNLASQGWEEPSKYFGSADVVQYDRSDNVLKTYKIDGMFPMEVGEIALSWEEQDSLEEFEVTFAVNEWRDESITKTSDANSLLNLPTG